ncbi:hypothetical protein [Rhodohalobacter barkolensis]|uniref:Uncharacterized protein n=1 Tax=Rhodohalobacter barkolensis TaxID=2053187 RepID=A0A2N0VIB4_9BACT|nr:hypothetical protein [Rhodohalobacter barkolensis]PKD43937.1 hypothetical protein CWD77_00190 [Rhodohalobacter barkolensis]
MIDKSNKSKDVEGSQLLPGHATGPHSNDVHPIVSNIDVIIQNLAGILQILTGIALITVSVLGMITPTWLSAILSIAGSVSCMFGVLLFYFTSAKKRSFESLINQSIRRVINSQN